jgi:hypothetical protein
VTIVKENSNGKEARLSQRALACGGAFIFSGWDRANIYRKDITWYYSTSNRNSSALFDNLIYTKSEM